MRRYLLTGILCLLLFFGCSAERQPPESLLTALEDIQTEWTPDSRTSVFSVEYEYENGVWNIQGETSVPQAKISLEERVRQIFEPGKFTIGFSLLPPEEFGDTTRALVNVSVGNLRSEPQHTASLVDQVVLGMALKLLKKQDDWYLVQTPSNYLGWITARTIQRRDSSGMIEWREAPKYSLAVNSAYVYSNPSTSSQPVTDLVLNTIFIGRSQNNGWLEIELPDGRTGYVNYEKIKPYTPADNNRLPNREAIVSRAKTMLGAPYMWGGNSTQAMDCSGFTSTVFRAEGYQLPRDANMQVGLGTEVIPDAEYSNLLPGDLIFFGPPDRITHVGISLGGSYYIHESGDVHISSLDETDSLFDAGYKKEFQVVKRIVN